MSKKRVLVVSEYHTLSTGYSNYSKELLSGLAKSGKYEVAELACYLSDDDPRPFGCPWKIYPAEPSRKHQNQERDDFGRDPANVFGKARFEKVCLDFKPTHVCEFRDFWMFDYQENSPYRPYYNWMLLPACDAAPQNEQWLYTYSKADCVFSYSDWGAEVLHSSSNGKIPVAGSASPCSPKEYIPLDTKKCRNQMELENEAYIIGTVMRNQRRKLYPELFESFRKFLDETKRNDVFLYCHTSYPDHGWDIPYLLKYYGVSNRVLFTYKCRNKECGHFGCSFFADATQVCPKCANLTWLLPNIQDGLTHQEMAVVYNCFDLYVQYSNSEGFGIPCTEAASCGVPLAVVNYSAMCDFVKKLGAKPIELAALYTELETGCKRAVPNNDSLIAILKDYFSLPKAIQSVRKSEVRDKFLANYSYEKTVAKWMDGIDNTNNNLPWDSQPRIHRPNNNIPDNLNNVDFVKFLITQVLGEPERLGTYFESRLIRDITYGFAVGGNPGSYFNEDSAKFDRTPYAQFNREIAAQYLTNMCEKRNFWENVRTQHA